MCYIRNKKIGLYRYIIICLVKIVLWMMDEIFISFRDDGNRY